MLKDAVSASVVPLLHCACEWESLLSSVQGVLSSLGATSGECSALRWIRKGYRELGGNVLSTARPNLAESRG